MILINDFHVTAAEIRPRQDEDGDTYITISQCRRAIKKLCGIEGCTCDKITGEYSPDLIHRILNAGYSGENKIYLSEYYPEIKGQTKEV